MLESKEQINDTVNADDGTPEIENNPIIKQQAIYTISYFGRADVLSSFYNLMAQYDLPYIVTEIHYQEGTDPSENNYIKYSKGFKHSKDYEVPSWDEFIKESRIIYNMNCYIYENPYDLEHYVRIEYNYNSSYFNKGCPMITVDFTKANLLEEKENSILGILKTSVNI